MNITTIKYCIAVAILSIATAFCGCDDKEEEVILTGSSDRMQELERADISDQPDDTLQQPQKVSTVKVYVCGAVRMPAVYEIEPGDRIADAVDMAGGFSEDAATGYLNLAAPVGDGQKIYIPTNAEIEEALADGLEIYGSEVNITTNSPGIKNNNNDGTSETANPDMVNINTADRSVLMTLPGIGEGKADKIIDYREKNGGFKSPQDIMLVAGIKEGLYNKIKDKICVD